MGGGDLSLGDTGHRGDSLSSDVASSFWGTGAFSVGSDIAGWRFGVVAADNTLCCAAEDGGLLLAGREGLTSLTLLVLDLPGPVERDTAWSGGRTGDDSLDGKGEVLAEADRFG